MRVLHNKPKLLFSNLGRLTNSRSIVCEMTCDFWTVVLGASDVVKESVKIAGSLCLSLSSIVYS